MSLQQIKRKIQSIKSTAKITNAMSLIATTKLKRQRTIYENNREYSKDFYRIIGFLLEELGNQANLTVKNAENRTLWININSTMGLCGAYNSSLDNFVSKLVKEGDYVYQIGKQGFEFWNYQLKIKNPIKEFYDFGEQRVSYSRCLMMANKILDLWKAGEINQINICLMRFINMLSAKPVMVKILPFDPSILDGSAKMGFEEFEFHPEEVELLHALMPDYIANMLYGSLIEAKVSEYALRRMAMDAATKNAKELGQHYRTEYNNARQAHITNEIIEIVNASNALKASEEIED